MYLKIIHHLLLNPTDLLSDVSSLYPFLLVLIQQIANIFELLLFLAISISSSHRFPKLYCVHEVIQKIIHTCKDTYLSLHCFCPFKLLNWLINKKFTKFSIRNSRNFLSGLLLLYLKHILLYTTAAGVQLRFCYINPCFTLILKFE